MVPMLSRDMGVLRLFPPENERYTDEQLKQQ
jgi:hypothetical protein